MAQTNHHTSISDAELGKQLLKKQLADLNKNPVEGFSAGLINDSDFFKWEVREYSTFGMDLKSPLILKKYWSVILVLMKLIMFCCFNISDSYHWAYRYSI